MVIVLTDTRAALTKYWSESAASAPGTSTLNTVTPGNAQVTLNVIPVVETDVVFARVAPANDPWPAENPTFSRTGTGNIIVTGLTNDILYKVTIYSKVGDITSDWTAPVFFYPTDGSDSLYEQIMDAVVARINAAALTNFQSVVISASVQIPPIFENVSTAKVIVFPDTAPLEPERSGLNNSINRVSLAFCEREKTASATQKGNQLFNRERIQGLFVGSRLAGVSSVYCQAEVSPNVLDMAEIKDHYNWISVMTLEFITLIARG